MRQWTVALLVAFAVSAFAQQGEELMPRVDVPGEQEVERQLAITDKQMDAWDLRGDDREAVKNKVAELNKAREELLGKLTEARTKLAEAEKSVADVLAALRQQEAALRDYIKPMLAGDKQADFDLRMRIQPLVDWLNLSEEQAGKLVAKRKELLDQYKNPGNGQDPVAELRAAATGEFDRKAYKDLAARYMKFTQDWLKAVREELNEEQKGRWDHRFRRTMHSLGIG